MKIVELKEYISEYAVVIRHAIISNMHSNVTRYSYFGAFRSDVSNVGPNSAMLNDEGKLTDIGSWYLGDVATHNTPQTSAGSIYPLNFLSIVITLCIWLLK